MNNITTAQTIISLPLRRIFQGKMFSATQVTSVSASGTIYYGITTLDFPLQFGFEISLTHDAHITFFKGSTHTGGSVLTSKNINDTSSETMNTIVFTGVTPSVNGTIWSEIECGDNPGTLYGNTNIGGRNEAYILKANSQYLLKVLDKSGLTNNFAVTFGFFDHV